MSPEDEATTQRKRRLHLQLQRRKRNHGAKVLGSSSAFFVLVSSEVCNCLHTVRQRFVHHNGAGGQGHENQGKTMIYPAIIEGGASGNGETVSREMAAGDDGKPLEACRTWEWPAANRRSSSFLASPLYENTVSLTNGGAMHPKIRRDCPG